ncbi:thiamine pyrophosphate-dependent enzyme, partial [Streptomyces sp. NPDC005921]
AAALGFDGKWVLHPGQVDAGEVPGMDVPDIDFTLLARGYGMNATSVSTPEDFAAAFKSALGSGKPALIEVETERTRP